jgi:hypothetical protein
MSHPYNHALSSVKKWGSKVEDYLPIHNWKRIILRQLFFLQR